MTFSVAIIGVAEFHSCKVQEAIEKKLEERKCRYKIFKNVEDFEEYDYFVSASGSGYIPIVDVCLSMDYMNEEMTVKSIVEFVVMHLDAFKQNGVMKTNLKFYMNADEYGNQEEEEDDDEE